MSFSSCSGSGRCSSVNTLKLSQSVHRLLNRQTKPLQNLPRIYLSRMRYGQNDASAITYGYTSTRLLSKKLYYPDRQRAIKDVAVFWCDHIDKTYVPSLYFVDIHTGERLTSYSCLGRMLQHSKKPTRAPQQPPSYNEDPSLLRPVPERTPIPQDDPSLWHPSPNQ